MTKQLTFNEFFFEITKLTPIKNQAELARELGVGRAAISLAKQKGRVPVKWIVDICSKYNLNPTYFLSGEGEPYLKPNKGQHKIIIEPFLKSELDKKDPNILEIKGDIFSFSQKDYFYIKMQDDSMSPTFKKGDVLFFEKNHNLSIGDIGIFEIKFADDHIVLVRRIGVGQKGLILISDNVTYPYLSYNTEIFSYLGKVVGFFRKV